MAIDRAVLLDAAGRPLRRRLVYLDHSTLVDAFEGKRGEGERPELNAELAAIVEDVASRGTLCLSFIHLVELAQRPRRDDALAMARWLDRLGVLWLQMYGSDDRDLTNEVKRRLGLKAAPAASLPIHHTMTAAIRPGLNTPALAEAATSFVSAPDLESVIRNIHGHPKLGEMLKHLRSRSVGLIAEMHANRSSIPAGTPPEQVEAFLAAKLRRAIEREACRVIATTPIERDESYREDADVRSAAGAALDDPDAIPLTKIGYHLAGRVSDRVTDSNPTSRSFTNRYEAFDWDSRHATAAAVVDVFTCDTFTDTVMGDFRTSRGMEPQLSIRGRGGREALVVELRRQCAQPRGGT